MTSILEDEIGSQPEVVARLLDRERDAIRHVISHLPAFDYVLIAARGSSDHAALYAKYVFAALAGHTVALAAPSLFTLYARPPRLAGALVIGISQSGQSPDIVAVLAEARRQGRPTIAITNEGASPLAAAADHVIALDAGPERSIAATKTYTAELAVIATMAACWSGTDARLAEVRELPRQLSETLARGSGIANDAQRLREMQTLNVVGRGYNYATAFEVALKLKELTYVMAVPYSAADFRHGPIATVGAGEPALLTMPTGQALADMLGLAAELRQRGAELLVLSDAPEALALGEAPGSVRLALPPGIVEWLSPLCAVIPGQLLAVHLARAKGIDPENPRGLNKVTRTR
jgi:glucosamine--fructose-6-phosphate aminotransferase (isomerizing)